MNKMILLAVLASVVISAQPVLAQQADPVEKSAKMQQVAPNIEEFDKHLAQMQENLKQMDALMEKISKTKDPKERQQLLQQYWTAMQGAMGTMHGMWRGFQYGLTPWPTPILMRQLLQSSPAWSQWMARSLKSEC